MDGRPSRLPILYVMHNNRAYHQEIMGIQRMANRRQRGIDRTHIGVTLRDPFIDYATMAKGLGIAAFGPITDPKELGAGAQEGGRDRQGRRAGAGRCRHPGTLRR